jgi:hypothetical protein
MFGLFKNSRAKPQPQLQSSQGDQFPGLVKLCELHEEFCKDVTDLYSEFEDYNPAELRFFTMSAVSVFVQAFGNLSESKMHSLVDKFTEQCVAMMLFYMPKADYSRVHNAFIARGPAYSNPIKNVLNAETVEAMEQSNFALISTMDHYIRVERDAIDASIAGLKIDAILSDLAINVRDALSAQ